MKKFLLLFFITTIAIAQNSNRKFENFKKVNNTLEVMTSDGKYIFKSYSEKIIETNFIPKGETFDASSHAVVLAPKTGLAKVKSDKNVIQFATSGIAVTIQKAPFKISYTYKSKELISEKNGYFKKSRNTKWWNL